MTTFMAYAKGLTIGVAVMIAGLALLLSMFIFRRGFANTLLWVIGLGALIIAGVNKLSYG